MSFIQNFINNNNVIYNTEINFTYPLSTEKSIYVIQPDIPLAVLKMDFKVGFNEYIFLNDNNTDIYICWNEKNEHKKFKIELKDSQVGYTYYVRLKDILKTTEKVTEFFIELVGSEEARAFSKPFILRTE